jgi:4-hydroxybenzoyl-CoA thioesterase
MDSMTEPARAIRFHTRRKLRFADVDPARIAFYPRYFEMLNGIVEDWFESMGWGFAEMHLEREIGIPTRKLEADFLRPSYLGDMLDLELSVLKVGRTSVDLETRFRCGEELRWKVKQTLVLVDMKQAQAVPWPDDLRQKLESGPAGGTGFTD